MATLPSRQYAFQQVLGAAVLSEEGTGRELLRVQLFTQLRGADGAVWRPNQQGFADTLKAIAASELGEEDKSWAQFWLGYFYGYTSVFSKDQLDAR